VSRCDQRRASRLQVSSRERLPCTAWLWRAKNTVRGVKCTVIRLLILFLSGSRSISLRLSASNFASSHFKGLDLCICVHILKLSQEREAAEKDTEHPQEHIFLEFGRKYGFACFSVPKNVHVPTHAHTHTHLSFPYKSRTTRAPAQT